MKSVIGSRSALIAAGLLACLYGPLQSTPAAAAPQDGATQESAAPVAKKKVVRPHAKKKPKAAKAAKPSAENATNDSQVSATSESPATPLAQAQAASGDQSVPASASLPASVANANAQLPQVVASDGAAPSPAEPGSAQPAAADGQVAAPNEMNELDRAAETAPPAVIAANVSSAAQPATTDSAQVSSATNNDGAWDKASLIGKIFIAAGGLLTLASAARMFIA